MILLHELKEILVVYDELTLVEKLEITSEQIVDGFDDIIEEKMDELIEQEEQQES